MKIEKFEEEVEEPIVCKILLTEREAGYLVTDLQRLARSNVARTTFGDNLERELIDLNFLAY